ncbi:MAG: hypothetical protein ACOX52_00910 [Verrucomicrobiota bacterium]
MEPTHPDRLAENVTAPSAGGFPGLRMSGGSRIRWLQGRAAAPHREEEDFFC